MTLRTLGVLVKMCAHRELIHDEQRLILNSYTVFINSRIIYLF